MGYIEDLWQATAGMTLLLPSAALVVVDPAGRLLLHRRGDDGTWCLVAGYLEIGESPEDAARREAREEVGLAPGPLRLLGVFAGPGIYRDYLGRGRVYSVITTFVAEGVSGEPMIDPAEVREARWFTPDNLPVDIESISRMLLDRFLDGAGR